VNSARTISLWVIASAGYPTPMQSPSNSGTL
jgi:hypothetical protein